MNTGDIHESFLTGETSRPLTTLTRISPTALGEFHVSQVADQALNLPLSNTRVGNVIKDRFDTTLFWYLPAFTLADEPDAAFNFAATQTGVDASGNPFNRATVTFGIKKVVPPDVQLSQTQNPTMTYREIPLAQLTGTLSTTFKDANGADQNNMYIGTVNVQNDGSLQLTFDNILGVGVIVAYENLAQDGGAQVTLAASYAVWQLTWRRVNPGWPPVGPGELPPGLLQENASIHVAPGNRASTQFHTEALAQSLSVEPSLVHPTLLEQAVEPSHILPVNTISQQNNGNEVELLRPFPRPFPPIGPISFVPIYTQTTASFGIAIPFAQKYVGVTYKQKFTVADGAAVRPILSADDLKNYNVRQSEFTEFLAFGDISAKYPSFSRLYVGVLSRTVVAIPTRYGITRGSAGCAAVCQALVDSSPAQTSSSKFQFAFSLGPVISPIDLMQLSEDIGAYPGLKDCTILLPSLLDSRVVPTLVTPFKSSCVYTNGALPHTFSLAVEIRDSLEDGPAVANANLFIKQLSSTVGPNLFGKVGIKLDDYYTASIEVAVVLNFSVTSGTDDLGFTIDDAQQLLTLVNRSPLDILLTRYAFYAVNHLTATSSQILLNSQKTTSLPLPSDHTSPDFQVLIDRTLSLEQPLTKQVLGRYLTFITQNVQSVQYELGVNASGVNFQTRGISSITVQVSFTDLPNVVVPAFTVSADHTVDSTRIVVPVEYAISSLAATLAFTVQLVNPQQSVPPFTRTNDFIDHVIFVLQDADIPSSV